MVPKDRIAWQVLKNSRSSEDFSGFIMSHPDSKYIDSTLIRFSRIKDSIEYDSYACGKYNAEVHAINATQILFNQELKPMDSLQFITFDYLTSELVNNLEIKIPRSNKSGLFSRAHIHFIVMEDSTKNRNLQKAIIEVSKGIKKYRDLLASNWYGKEYTELRDSTKHYMDRLFQHKVSLIDHYEPSYPSPK
tara:strand:- start:3433 stop:4005 length:573 start_codon:yes stop_codon:yes gene_type:complete